MIGIVTKACGSLVKRRPAEIITFIEVADLDKRRYKFLSTDLAIAGSSKDKAVTDP
ncbi:MAG TPA: hypothetical protein VIX19_19490 [Terriglobales bacterium]